MKSTSLDAKDVINLEEGIRTINRVVDKYDLQLNSALLYLSIVNTKKYPNPLIKKKENLVVDLDAKEEYPVSKSSFNANMMDAFKIYIEKHLTPTKNKRRWIHIRKLIENFLAWFSGSRDKVVDKGDRRVFETVCRVLNGAGIQVKGVRISGYTLV